MWILTRKKKHSIIKQKDYVKLKVITVFTNELLERALGEESESESWKAAPCSCVHDELLERVLGGRARLGCGMPGSCVHDKVLERVRMSSQRALEGSDHDGVRQGLSFVTVPTG